MVVPRKDCRTLIVMLAVLFALSRAMELLRAAGISDVLYRASCRRSAWWGCARRRCPSPPSALVALGADLTSVLFGRLAFAIAATAAVAFVLQRLQRVPVAPGNTASTP